MSVKLSEGCIARLYAGEKLPGPIVQVLDIKQIASAATGKPLDERYRIIISDSINSQNALLATQNNELVKQGRLKPLTVVRLVDHCITDIQARKVIIIAKIEILTQPDSRIGNPVPFDSSKMTNTSNSTNIRAPLPTTTITVSTPNRNQNQQKVVPITTPIANVQTNQPPQQQQQQPGAGEDLEKLPIHPIRSLNPYQNRWCIRARVTSKSALKEYTNARGNGKLFNVDLIDSSGDEIRATCFNEQADKFYPILQQGQCYLISRGSLKAANKKYTTIQHEYEITLNSASAIQPTRDEVAIPHAHYSFIPIDKIAEREKDDIVDVLGVVTASSDLQNLTQKSSGNPLSKRTITLVDMSSHSIEVTLWAEKAQMEIPNGSVVAVRSCKVSTFNNKSLTGTVSSVVDIAPDIDEAHKLRGWYDAQGGQLTIYPITQFSAGNAGGAGGNVGGEHEDRFLTLNSVKEDKIGMTNEAEYFSTVGVVTLIKHDNKISYQACSQPKCGSKVTQGADGMYFCAKCNKSSNECSERYILSMTIADYTGSLWLSMFNEHAEKLLGISAQELVAKHNSAAPLNGVQQSVGAGGDNKEYERVFYDASWRWYSFRVRAKMEQYREENRQKCSVVKLVPLDFVAESKRLLQLIDSYH